MCARPRMCAVLCSFMKWTMRAASNQMSNRTFWLEIHSRGCAVLSVQWMHLRYKTNVCGYSHSYMWCAINAIWCQEKLCLKSQLTTKKNERNTNATILIVTEFTFFFIFRINFHNWSSSDIGSGWSGFNRKMFSFSGENDKIRLVYFLAAATLAERLNTFTIFCSSIKKARTIRSRTHRWQSTPP